MIFTPSLPDRLPTILADAASLLTAFTFAVSGLALVYHTKPRHIRSLAWIPAIFLY